MPRMTRTKLNMVIAAVAALLAALLSALVIVVGVGVLSGSAETHENKREIQFFSDVFSFISSLFGTLVSLVLGFPQAVVDFISFLVFLLFNVIISAISFLTSSVTSTTATTTTTTLATTVPIISSTSIATSMMTTSLGTVIDTTSMPTFSTSPGATMMIMPTTSSMRPITTTAAATTTVAATTTTSTSTSTTATTTIATTTTTTAAPPTSKLAFVTKGTYSGNLGGIEGADRICHDSALAANYSGTFFAWISDATVSPFTRFMRSTLPYLRVDNMTVALNFSTLTSNQDLLVSLNLDEFGGVADDLEVWTNTDLNGNRTSDNDCDGWTSNATNLRGGSGVPFFTDSQWTNLDSNTCDQARKLYCFEQ